MTGVSDGIFGKHPDSTAQQAALNNVVSNLAGWGAGTVAEAETGSPVVGGVVAHYTSKAVKAGLEQAQGSKSMTNSHGHGKDSGDSANSNGAYGHGHGVVVGDCTGCHKK